MKEDNRIHHYEGRLEIYFETGFEHLALILQDKRSLTPNDQYIPGSTEFPHNIPEWASLSYALFLNDGDYLEVYSKDGNVIEWSGTITKDRLAMKEDGYRCSLIVKEVPKEQWFKWFNEERKAIAYSKTAPHAEEYKNEKSNTHSDDSTDTNSGTSS